MKKRFSVMAGRLIIFCIGLGLLISGCSDRTPISSPQEHSQTALGNEEQIMSANLEQNTNTKAQNLKEHVSGLEAPEITAAAPDLIVGDKTEENPRIELVQKMADAFAADENFQGSILIAEKGEILFRQSYGKADREKDIDNTAETRYMIASMTKQFAAMSILILQEQGLLSVNDTVDKYLPSLPMGDKITIHQLLTHTSGLPVVLPGSRGDGYLKGYPGKTNEEKLLNAIENKDIYIAFPPPGSTFYYSDINYMIVGHIVEKASGLSFEEFLKQNIFIPLEMDNTGTGYFPSGNPNLAIGYGPVGNRLQEGLTCADMGYGAGSMYSTVDDMYKWDRALNSEILVSKQALEDMFTPYHNTYGYGWWFSETNKGLIPVHGGRLLNGTFSGFFVRNTITDTCVIVLGNDGFHDEKRDFAMQITLELMKK